MHDCPGGKVSKILPFFKAYFSVSVLRKAFDIASGYTIGKHLKSLDERDVLIRCIFLETVAGLMKLLKLRA